MPIAHTLPGKRISVSMLWKEQGKEDEIEPGAPRLKRAALRGRALCRVSLSETSEAIFLEIGVIPDIPWEEWSISAGFDFVNRR